MPDGIGACWPARDKAHETTGGPGRRNLARLPELNECGKTLARKEGRVKRKEERGLTVDGSPEHLIPSDEWTWNPQAAAQAPTLCQVARDAWRVRASMIETIVSETSSTGRSASNRTRIPSREYQEVTGAVTAW